ncbi:1-pyrroline-5-carboxylate dehydrogenase domain protein [Mycobacterium xenopi 4042]|uniref:1-pyrroline-5-carboxylate dehydrogenase domain protein n=1 Tax=Mycobacterium xenopi 4042 TaxID=1299334 RepID=X8DXB9_MYCXE|nr:1-pyrroline-5-carboxylate dehydrogenase domain protein [Mycobacterium xenopi 4042]
MTVSASTSCSRTGTPPRWHAHQRHSHRCRGRGRSGDGSQEQLGGNTFRRARRGLSARR